MDDAFDYLAQRLARARARWDEEVLALVRSVAIHQARIKGFASEDELEVFCRRHGLPCPELKHLFAKFPLGDWAYLRGGMWRFEPAPAPLAGDWSRRWDRLPPQRAPALPKPAHVKKA